MSEDEDTNGPGATPQPAGPANSTKRRASSAETISGGDRHAPSNPKSSATMMRLAAAGLELASFALILGAAGYWFDNNQGYTTPYFGVAGVLIGFALGMYRLVRLAMKTGGQ